MGQEATSQCRWPQGAGEVKALLESGELILRGALKRSFALAAMTMLRVEGEALCFTLGGEAIALELGADRAGRWAKKIANPPSLAAKLGLGPAAKALVIGSVADAALQAALDGCVAASAEEARLCLATVTDEASLGQALHLHDTLLAGTPLWIVHGKGPQAAFGGDAVRRLMRAGGYRDTKIAGVSNALSATRYARG